MKVTSKGQVTIPAPIRAYLGIVPHTEVAFELREGQVVLTAPKPEMTSRRQRIESMRGTLKGKFTTAEWMKMMRGD